MPYRDEDSSENEDYRRDDDYKRRRTRNRNTNNRGRWSRGAGYRSSRGTRTFTRRTDRQRSESPHRDRTFYNRNRRADKPVTLAQVLETVKDSFQSISARISTLEKDSTGRGVKRSFDSTRPPADEEGLSNNPQFPELRATLFRLVQTRHHLSKWQVLPASCKHLLDNLLKTLRPPLRSTELTRAIELATSDFADKLLEIINGHLTHKLDELHREASSINSQDLDRATRMVRKSLISRFGDNLTSSDRDRLLLEEGGSFAPPRRSSHDTPAPDNVDELRLLASESESELPPRSPRFVSPLKRTSTTTVSPPLEDPGMDTSTPHMKTPPATPRFTNKPFLNRMGVYLYGGDKNNWRIQPSGTKRNLVIGDSNLRNPPAIPTNLEIHSLPGANLRHVCQALDAFGEDDNYNIIVQVGINNRDDTDQYLREMVARLNASAIAHLYIVGVSFPTTLPRAQRAALEFLNTEARTTIGLDHYIEPLLPEDTYVQTYDESGIHYTKETVKTILDNISMKVHPL